MVGTVTSEELKQSENLHQRRKKVTRLCSVNRSWLVERKKEQHFMQKDGGMKGLEVFS